MISSICIEGFRRFDAFKLENLGRINLIMGDNNCGRTTVLEAIHLLTSRASREALTQAIRCRDRTSMPSSREHRAGYRSSIASLFFGHIWEKDATFKLYSKSPTSGAHLTAKVTDEIHEKLQGIYDIDGKDPEMVLRLEGDPEPFVTHMSISSSDETNKEMLNWSSRDMHCKHLTDCPNSISITPARLDSLDLISMWNDIVKTPEEERVIRTLGCLDSGIERIVAQFSGGAYKDADLGHAGMFVKHKQFSERVPIESFGSGIWRLFSLALVVVRCQNGTLLVDEIDNGLDLDTQLNMCRMLLSIATESNVQIFATTHNLDCVNTLAEEACRASVDSNGGLDEVVFHRIEVGKQGPVQLSPNQVRFANKHFLEVR